MFVVCFPSEFVNTRAFGKAVVFETGCELETRAVDHAFVEGLAPVVALLAFAFVGGASRNLYGIVDGVALD